MPSPPQIPSASDAEKKLRPTTGDPDATLREETIAAVAKDELTLEEAAARLDTTPEVVQRLVKKAARSKPQRDGQPLFAEGGQQRIDENWGRAAEGIVIEEELPPMEAAIQSFAPARWLFGTEVRRILFALAACVVIGIGVYVLAIRDTRPGIPDDRPTAPPLGVTEARRDLAEDVARTFLAAQSWEEKLELVRKPERARLRMAEWYATHDIEAFPNLGEPMLGKTTTVAGLPFVMFDWARPDSSTAIIVAVDLSESEPKVDWESHVLFQPMTIAEFLKSRPAEPVTFRVKAAKDDYYNFEFSDPEKFLSVKLTTPRGIETIYGFAERDSPIGIDLKNVLDGRKPRSYRITLQIPEGSSAGNVARIVRVMPDWIEP